MKLSGFRRVALPVLAGALIGTASMVTPPQSSAADDIAYVTPSNRVHTEIDAFADIDTLNVAPNPVGNAYLIFQKHQNTVTGEYDTEAVRSQTAIYQIGRLLFQEGNVGTLLVEGYKDHEVINNQVPSQEVLDKDKKFGEAIDNNPDTLERLIIEDPNKIRLGAELLAMRFSDLYVAGLEDNELNRINLQYATEWDSLLSIPIAKRNDDWAQKTAETHVLFDRLNYMRSVLAFSNGPRHATYAYETFPGRDLSFMIVIGESHKKDYEQMIENRKAENYLGEGTIDLGFILENYSVFGVTPHANHSDN